MNKFDYSVRLIVAHPQLRKSNINRRLFQLAREIPGIDIGDLYHDYADFLIDRKKEQKRLEFCQTVVLQFPFFWYSVPALLKEWMDEVLELGWAYGKNGTHLAGKNLLVVTTTGGKAEAYQRSGHNHFTMKELLRPLEQTAYLCGMKPLEPLILNGAKAATEVEIHEFAQNYKSTLIYLTQGRFPKEYTTCTT